MKKITELSEQEIYALKEEEIDIMVKLSKAENGIKLIQKPPMPSYLTEAAKDITVFTCTLFGDNLVFLDVTELTKVIESIRSSTTVGRLDYDWNKAGNDSKYFTSGVKKKHSYSSDDLSTSSESAFSLETYTKTIDVISHNKKLKENYEKEIKEYEDSITTNKWIEDEILDKVRGVREKFHRLNEYAYKFKWDYLPIAENNESIAMGFMDKAYSLTEEQKEYILANYKNN